MPLLVAVLLLLLAFLASRPSDLPTLVEALGVKLSLARARIDVIVNRAEPLAEVVLAGDVGWKSRNTEQLQMKNGFTCM